MVMVRKVGCMPGNEASLQDSFTPETLKSEPGAEGDDRETHLVLRSTTTVMYVEQVVVIEFWHGFVDYDYLSLNRQLIPITITAYK